MMSLLKMDMWIFLLTIIVIKKTDGFATGAPHDSCWTRYPEHPGTPASHTGPCPFILQPSSVVYTPGRDVSFTLSDPTSSATFKGFEVGVYRPALTPGGTEELVGTFTQVPQSKGKIFSCFPGRNNIASHANNDPVTSVVLTWRPPSDNAGNLTVRFTVVQHLTSFWAKNSLSINVDPSVTTIATQPVYPTVAMTSLARDLDLSTCGTTQGCLLYPGHCTGRDCIATFCFLYRPQTDDFHVELSTDTDDYISVGFSHDREMGDDATVTCVAQGGEMSVQHGYNQPHKYNERLLTRYISSPEVRHVDGRLQCSFLFARRSEVTLIDESGPDFKVNNITFDLLDPWYVLMAWGKSLPESVVMGYHEEMPIISNSKIDLRKIATYRASAFPLLVQMHVAVMMVCWVFVAGLATIVARHFKNWLPARRACNTKVWFQVHRTLAMLIALLTGAGIAVIFKHYGKEIREAAKPHAYVGLSVAGAVGLQVMMGVLRPGPDSRVRGAFNWGHRLLGLGAQVAAAATMFLGFDIKYFNKDMKTFGIYTLSVWVGVQVLWQLVFECIRRRRDTKSFDLTKTDRPAPGSGTDTILLAVYTLCIAGVTSAALMAFLFY